MANKTINAVWAQLSTNKQSFTEEEIQNGILYKGPIVSNQLNGIASDLYAMMDVVQRSGGLYNERKTYFKNDVVSILRQDLSGPLRVEQYACITGAATGITNTPPILNATYDSSVKIPIFQGGYVDTQNWVRCDSVGVNETYQSRSTFQTRGLIKLFNIPSSIQTDKASVPMEGKYRISVQYREPKSISIPGQTADYLIPTDKVTTTANNTLGTTIAPFAINITTMAGTNDSENTTIQTYKRPYEFFRNLANNATFKVDLRLEEVTLERTEVGDNKDFFYVKIKVSGANIGNVTFSVTNPIDLSQYIKTLPYRSLRDGGYQLTEQKALQTLAVNLPDPEGDPEANIYINTTNGAAATSVSTAWGSSSCQLLVIKAPLIVGVYESEKIEWEDTKETASVTTFDVNISGSYTQTGEDNTATFLPNRLGLKAPEISFGNVSSNVVDYGEPGDFFSLMPYGLRFEYSAEEGEDASIYMRLHHEELNKTQPVFDIRKEYRYPGCVEKVTIEGSGSYINVELGLDGSLNKYIPVAVRGDGGFKMFDNLGDIVQKDFTLPTSTQYKMGLYILDAGRTNYPKMTSTTQKNTASPFTSWNYTQEEETDEKDSPLWGLDKTATSPLFGALMKVTGTNRIPDYRGGFLRNLGEEQLDGLDLINSGITEPEIRPIGTLRRDAIRNIVGSTLTPSVATGVFVIVRDSGFPRGRGDGTCNEIKIDSSKTIPVAADNYPTNVATQFYYKAF